MHCKYTCSVSIIFKNPKLSNTSLDFCTLKYSSYTQCNFGNIREINWDALASYRLLHRHNSLCCLTHIAYCILRGRISRSVGPSVLMIMTSEYLGRGMYLCSTKHPLALVFHDKYQSHKYERNRLVEYRYFQYEMCQKPFYGIGP